MPPLFENLEKHLNLRFLRIGVCLWMPLLEMWVLVPVVTTLNKDGLMFLWKYCNSFLLFSQQPDTQIFQLHDSDFCCIDLLFPCNWILYVCSCSFPMKWTKACVYETLIELENRSDTTFPDKNPRFNEAPGALFFSFYGYKFCFQFLLVQFICHSWSKNIWPLDLRLTSCPNRF